MEQMNDINTDIQNMPIFPEDFCHDDYIWGECPNCGQAQVISRHGSSYFGFLCMGS